MSLVAGVDCSTQATKVVIVEVESGEVVSTTRAEHVVTGSEGARETDPLVWWDALRDALGQSEMSSSLAAISVAGQQHGLVVLDEAGAPLRSAMLWNDTRAAEDADSLIEFLGREWWAEIVGVVPVASFTVSKWAWLRRNEPDIAARTRSIRLPHDYLTERLAGSGVTDRGDASGTGWWASATEAYHDEVLELPLVELDKSLLPNVLGPDQSAGTLTRAAADDLGLPPGIPVGPGTGDNAGAALGLGLKAGTPVVSLGTSGTAYTVSTTRATDPSGTVAGFADATGRFLPLAATLNCTLAVDRVAELLKIDREAAAPDTDVVVLPYFDGERTPNLPNAAGTISGLRHATEPGEILLAAYRGAAASLLEAVEAVDSHGSGLDDGAALVLIGGGARGETWRRVIGELSGRALQIPAATELVAIGAAAQSAAIVSGEAPEAVAQGWNTLAGETLAPVARNEEAIRQIRRVRELTAGL